MASLTHLAALLVSISTIVAGQNTAPWHTITTFNAALTGVNNFTPFYMERRTALLESIVKDAVWKNTDVLCLQEVVEAADRLAIAANASTVGLTHAYVDGTVESSDELEAGKACQEANFVSLATCVRNSSCNSKANLRETLQCATKLCSMEVARLSQTCINCVISSGELGKAIGCVQASAKNYSTNLGLMILSKNEILHSSITAFSTVPTLFRRGYLRADIKSVGTVFCSHTQPFQESAISEINGVGAQINLQQVQALVAAANGHQSIIAGDLNTSPDLPSIGVSGLFEPSYQYALSQYLSSPYVNNTGSMCTFCTDNPILDLMATSSNITYLSTILDHVLVNRQVFNVDEKSIKRVFSETVATVNASGIDLDITLSDHYGVQVRVQSAATAQASSFTLVLALAAYLLLFPRT